MAYLVQTPFLHCSLLRKRKKKKRTYYLLPNKLTPISKGKSPLSSSTSPQDLCPQKTHPLPPEKGKQGAEGRLGPFLLQSLGL
jgi:hypothetical protein